MRAEEIKGLMEAYSHVYETPEVLSEEVVEKDVEVLDEQGGPESNFRQKARIRQDLAIQKAGGGAAGEEKRFQELKAKNVRPTQPGQARQRWRPQSDDALRRQAGYDVRRQGETNLRNASTKPAAPAKPAPTPAAKPAPAPAAKPAPAPAAKPTPSATAKPSTPAAPAKPAPGTKAAGPESIKPKTPNPLLKDKSIERMQQASQMRQKGANVTSDMISDKSVKAPAPKPQMSARAQALKAGGPAGSARERMLNQGVDIFDLVKGHLLGEGYAETEENAIVMMANMSEEWRKSILEAHGVEILDEAQHARENPEKHEEESEKEDEKKYGKVRGEKTPMPPRGDKRREAFEKWYATQMGR